MTIGSVLSIVLIFSFFPQECFHSRPSIGLIWFEKRWSGPLVPYKVFFSYSADELFQFRLFFPSEILSYFSWFPFSLRFLSLHINVGYSSCFCLRACFLPRFSAGWVLYIRRHTILFYPYQTPPLIHSVAASLIAVCILVHWISSVSCSSPRPRRSPSDYAVWYRILVFSKCVNLPTLYLINLKPLLLPIIDSLCLNFTFTKKRSESQLASR